MKIGSLFSGMGGFELAFDRAGFETSWCCEIDTNCRKLLSRKFPKAKIWEDVTTFNPDAFECPDVITFGSPCQDFSIAGQRAGIEGERSGLFYHATRIIRGFVGRGLEFALWENVPGVLSSNGPRDFAGILGEVGKCGALDIGWRILDAQWFGVPQRRKRVFLVADFRGRRAAEVLSLAESLLGHPPPSRETGQAVAPTVGGCSNGRGANGPGRTVDDCEALAPVTSNRIAGHHSRNDLDNDTYVMAHGQANAEIVRDGSPSLTCNHEAPIAFSSKDSGNDAGELSPTLRAQQFKDSHMNGGGQVAIAFPANLSATQSATTEDLAPVVQSDNPTAIAFDTTQVTSKGNYSNPKAGDACHPLAAGAHPPAIAFKPSHFTRDKDGAPSETTPPLSADADKGDQDPVVFQSRIARNGHGVPSPVCGERAAHATGDSKPLVATSTVRRLTPTECERLMGAPDGWTEGFSDSVRYRMLGNSVAIPVVEFIARRLMSAIKMKVDTASGKA